MRKQVRRILYRFLPSRLLLPLILLLKGRRAGLVGAWGYARSVRLMRPVDEHDHPLPWLPYCAIELLNERIDAVQSVLEFGSGHSTFYFMARVARVTSVEHHAAWLETVRSRVDSNVTILQASRESAESYTAAIRASADRFDLILVDGQQRVACFQLALERLTPEGVIVLDDSDRSAYAEVFPLAAQAGFRTLHLRGHKADSVQLHRTSFFYRDRNCLGI